MIVYCGALIEGGGAGCRSVKNRSYATVQTNIRCGVGTPSAARINARRLAAELRYSPTVFISHSSNKLATSTEQTSSKTNVDNGSKTGKVCAALPPNVHLQTLQPFAAHFSEPMTQGTPCHVTNSRGALVDLSSLPPATIKVKRPTPPPHPPPPPPLHPFKCPGPGHPHYCQSGCVSTPLHGCQDCVGKPWRASVAFPRALPTLPNVTIVKTWNTLGGHTNPGVCCGNTFTETAQNVSTVGFELDITRTDKKSGFGQQLHVQWLACHEAVVPLHLHHQQQQEQVLVESPVIEDAYTIGFCNTIRCPTPGQPQNFGYVLRTQHLGQPMCDRSWPAPLLPRPLQPRMSVGANGREEVILTTHAISDDGVHAPALTGDLEIALHCDPNGERDVVTLTNASLISDGVGSARYVPYRLELSSRCACPGGCPAPAPPSLNSQATTSRSPFAHNATMPSDGSFIVRLQHLYGATEGLGALSAPATVDLASLFCQSGQKIAQVQEVSLSANQDVADIHHWHWRRRDDGTVFREAQEVVEGGLLDGTIVTMAPLTTRTFVVTVTD